MSFNQCRTSIPSFALCVLLCIPSVADGSLEVSDEEAAFDRIRNNQLFSSTIGEALESAPERSRAPNSARVTVKRASSLTEEAVSSAALQVVAQSGYRKYEKLLTRYYFGQHQTANSQLRELVESLKRFKGLNCEAWRSAKPSCRVTRLMSLGQLLLARMALERDAPSRALTYIDSARVPQTLKPYVELLRARAHRRNQSIVRASEIYASIQTPRDRFLKALIKTEEALTFAEAGRWNQALARLEEVVATYPESPFIARLKYEKARVLEAMGRTSDAVHQYQKLRLNYPSRPAGDVAGRRLKHLKKKDVRIPHLRAETIFQHARQLRLNRQYRAALDRFERLEKRGLSRDLEARVDIQKALIAFARQDNQIALELLGSLRERAREDPVDSIDRRLIFSLLSQTYARLGYQKKAVMALKQEYKSHSSTVRKKKLAEFYKSQGKTQKAFQLFDRLNPYWWSGSWTRAWLLFKSGEYRRAKKAFLSLKRRNRSPEALKYKYWAARAMAKSGEYRHARRLFASIVEVAPFDYYGIQARHQLTRGLQSNQRPALSLDSVAKRVASHDVTGTFDDVMRVGVVDRPPNRSLMERLRLQPKIPGAKTGAGVRRYGGESSNCVEKTRERSVESQPGDILDKLVGSTSCGLSGLAPLGDGPAVLERSNEPASAKFKWQAPERHRAEGSQPFPERSTAYLSSPGLESMNEFERRWRRLFPEFSRAKWLYMTGFRTSARQELRNIYTEIKAVRNRGYPRQKPHDLSDISVNDYYIDRRRDRSGFWGIEKHRALVTAPQTTAQKRRQLNRQQRIARQGEQLISGLLEPLKVVGNHHLVRDITSYRTSYPNSLVGQASLRKHRDAWSNLYPRAYSHHVLRVAHDSEVNPYLIWSLMGIESSYNPDSISVAEAIGLLQMIPSTGKKVADRLQQEETFGAYKLLEPEHSVEYGVYYFKQLLEKFHGQHILAIPAYNAGPHRVASWVEKRGHLRIDEFIEDIPFSEARNYTKKAIESMARYTHVYEPEFDFRLGSRINPRYRADPDF